MDLPRIALPWGQVATHNGAMPQAVEVQQMFARVAPRYDLLNRVLSCGIDIWWRRQAVRFAGLKAGERALDVCAGTGDLSLTLLRHGALVTGSDFCQPMLVRAAKKALGTGVSGRFVTADTMELPFRDQSFDLVTVAFGIRNVADPVAGLSEMRRVTRRGGRIVVLEFCRPRTPVLGPLYMFYFRKVLPRIGALVSGDSSAYTYLPESVLKFPEREAFLERMEQAGLVRARQRILTGGIAALYRGEVEA